MRKRFLNNTTITGYGSLILSILPFFEEGKTVSFTMGVLIFIGTFLILFGILKKPPKERLERSIVNMTYESRKDYILPLYDLFKNYINAVTSISARPIFHSLETYGNYKYRLNFPVFFLFGNIPFLSAEEKELANMRSMIASTGAIVKDKRVRNFAEGLPDACRMAGAYTIYAQVCRDVYGEKAPLTIRIWMFLGEKMANRMNRHYGKIKTIMDSLLEVTEDEL